MFKKIYLAFLAVFAVVTTVLILFRVQIFPTTIYMEFQDEAATCKSAVNGVIEEFKCPSSFKLHVPYGSKVEIYIKSQEKVDPNYIRIGDKRSPEAEILNYYDVSYSKGATTFLLKEPAPSQCAFMKPVFEHPYITGFSLISAFGALLGILFAAILFFQKRKDKIINFYKNFAITEAITLKALKIATFLMLGLFFYIQITNIGFDYDAAYNATISKNIAQGIGYVSSYNGIVTFNPEITTGYTMIFPVALGIKIFSNQYWVPGLVSTLLIFALLLAVLYVPKHFNFIDEKKLWSWRIVFIALMLFASNGILYFTSLLGEVPAAFFVILSALILILSKERKSFYFLAGFLASCALVTKILTLISVVPVFLAYLLLKFRSFKELKAKIWSIAWFFIGLAVPLALFEIYKIASLGSFAKYLKLKNTESLFFSSSGSGVDSIWKVFVNLFRNSFAFVKEFGILRMGIFIILPLVSLVWMYRKREDKKYAPVYLLSAAVLFNALWWFVLCPTHWFRHLLIGYILFLAMLSFSVFIFNNKNKLMLSLIILLFLTVPSSLNVSKALFNPKNPFDTPYELKEASGFILSHPDYKYYGCGWWANRHLEYILPGVNNFSDCLRGKFKKKAVNILVREKAYWNLDRSRRIDKIQRKCEKNIIFENKGYVFSKCE